MNESTATRYQRFQRSLRLVRHTVGVVWLLVVVFTPVGRWFADRAAALAPQSVFLVFVLGLVVAREVVALPVGVRVAIRGERRFRRATSSTFKPLHTAGRDAITGVVFLVCAASVVWWSFQLFGAWWWLACGLMGAPVLVGASALAGAALRTGAGTAALRREGLAERLATLAEQVCGRRVPVREWIDAEGAAPSALVTGVGATGVILLSREIIRDWSDDEVAVVVAHELAHHARHDLWRKAVLDAGVLMGSLWWGHVVVSVWGPGLGVAGRHDLMALPLAALGTLCLWTALRPLRLAQSRQHERVADQQALAITGTPEAFRSALRRLAVHHKSEEHPSLVTRWFFHRHPTVDERLRIVSGG